ncbi:MAG: FKBP-type peptidyl-prolyl cis-trans isomerase [Bacteroidales bacterium]|nr:FKBP-type peptidyl-prolyl cis-trans isomerase [Bacteroidales bacterium]
MDKISYALGLSMGQNFQSSGIKSLNFDDFSRALKAVYEGTQPEISYDEAKQVINSFFEKLQNEALTANQSQGEEFLLENSKKPGVITLASGLQYEILKAGEGVKPTATDSVKCHYHGTLIDGRVFDSSVERKQPAVFGVNQVIQGWVEALQLMPIGSLWRLYIPSHLAYGERGAGEMIGPNTALVFDVELLEIV